MITKQYINDLVFSTLVPESPRTRGGGGVVWGGPYIQNLGSPGTRRKYFNGGNILWKSVDKIVIHSMTLPQYVNSIPVKYGAFPRMAMSSCNTRCDCKLL